MRAAALALSLFATAAAAADPPDPLGSPLWPEIRAQVLGSAPVTFDSRVTVTAPANAENTSMVPVAVTAEGIGDVRQIVLFADYNPIPRILAFHPVAARPFVAARFKINMATPVRAAALDGDGRWHVGGTWVDAAGGGCSAPSTASAHPDWQDRLGEVHARAWRKSGDGARLRFQVRHPMDTGLAGNIPAFYLEQVILSTASGRELARIETFEPVAENPLLTVEVKAKPDDAPYILSGRDNGGNTFAARIAEGGAP